MEGKGNGEGEGKGKGEGKERAGRILMIMDVRLCGSGQPLGNGYRAGQRARSRVKATTRLGVRARAWAEGEGMNTECWTVKQSLPVEPLPTNC